MWPAYSSSYSLPNVTMVDKKCPPSIQPGPKSTLLGNVWFLHGHGFLLFITQPVFLMCRHSRCLKTWWQASHVQSTHFHTPLICMNCVPVVGKCKFSHKSGTTVFSKVSVIIYAQTHFNGTFFMQSTRPNIGNESGSAFLVARDWVNILQSDYNSADIVEISSIFLMQEDFLQYHIIR